MTIRVRVKIYPVNAGDMITWMKIVRVKISSITSAYHQVGVGK